jgi:hypothetical protein
MMERDVKVFLQDGEVLLCDCEYCWDISKLVSQEDRLKAATLTEGKTQESPHDLTLCGETKVTVDDVEFYKHLLEKEIESKVEIQRGLGENIIELEAGSLTGASDEDILTEAKRRGLL